MLLKHSRDFMAEYTFVLKYRAFLKKKKKKKKKTLQCEFKQSTRNS